MGEPRLAEQLRTKYCKTEGAAGQLLYITKTMRSFLVTRVTNLNYQFFTAKATQWPKNSHWFGHTSIGEAGDYMYELSFSSYMVM